ncbi:MAG TPA: hypothetical protein VGP24_04625, partial [Glaciihabitans sp.]|nr:hypothetical protein [Glaciihabitans sp.]
MWGKKKPEREPEGEPEREPDGEHAAESDTSLTNPAGVYVLRERDIPGGSVSVSGFATVQGVRVEVKGVGRDGRARIWSDTRLSGMRTEHYSHGAWGYSGTIDFRWLSRFWLSRTSTFDEITEHTPRPGRIAQINGHTVGIADTCGTVSLDGTPQLQVIWRGADAPAGGEVGADDWVLDGYGEFTTLVERRTVKLTQHVEWTAVWRDITVTVAAIDGESAVIFTPTDDVPDFDVPELVHGRSRRSGWSAVVPLGELYYRSWTSTEEPLGPGFVNGHVGLVRGRTAVVGVPRPNYALPAEGDSSPDMASSALVAIRLRGQSITPDFAVDPRRDSRGSGW